jgi:hypothetical protein
MLRKLIRRLFGRGDKREIDVSGVERDRLLTHPSDNRYDEGRSAGEAADAAMRQGPPGGGFP